MRRLCIVLSFFILALAIALSSLSPASAQVSPDPTDQPLTGIDLTIEPKLSSVLDVQLVVDQWLDKTIPNIQAVEDQYYNDYGLYWQGLSTNSDDLKYSLDTDAKAIPDNLLSKPTDGIYTWADTLPDLQNETAPAVLTIDIYDGPEGQGYVVLASFEWNGDRYISARNFGPEIWRDQPWTLSSKEP